MIGPSRKGTDGDARGACDGVRHKEQVVGGFYENPPNSARGGTEQVPGVENTRNFPERDKRSEKRWRLLWRPNTLGTDPVIRSVTAPPSSSA